jgi:hypothetical protein
MVVYNSTIVDARGYCLFPMIENGVDKRKPLTLSPVRKEPFRLARGLWQSPRPVTQVISIFMQEIMETQVYDTKDGADYTYQAAQGANNSITKTFLAPNGAEGVPLGEVVPTTGGSSEALLTQVAGCANDVASNCLTADPPLLTNSLEDPPSSWGTVEAWYTSGNERVLKERFVDYVGAIGYTTLPGLYMYNHTAEKALADGVQILWYETLKDLSKDGRVKDYFTNPVELDARLNNIACIPSCGDNQPTRPWDGANFLGYTRGCVEGNAGYANLVEQSAVLGIDLHPEYCLSNPAGGTNLPGWWISPTCGANLETDCIPVVLWNPAWNAWEWVKAALESEMPFAITWTGVFGGSSIMNDLQGVDPGKWNYLTYWWARDRSPFASIFGNSPPVLMHFATDRSPKLLTIQQTQHPAKAVWKEISRIDEQLYQVWKAFELRDGDANYMLDLIGLPGIGDYHAACRWMQAFPTQWAKWEPQWEDCAQGSYNAKHEGKNKRNYCTLCVPGKYSNARRMTECINCAAGKFQLTAGQSVCSICPVGEYSNPGAAGCDECERGRYAPNVETSACTACDAGKSTVEAGANRSSQCVCAEGSYFSKGGQVCTTCPKGMICAVGSTELAFDETCSETAPATDPNKCTPEQEALKNTAPQVAPGFYTSRSRGVMEVFECRPESVCPGGAPESCTGKRTGLVCGLCPDDYVSGDDDCQECNSGDKVGAALGICLLAIVPLAVYAVFNVEHHWKLSPKEAIPLTNEVIVELLQVSASVTAMEVTYPDFAKHLFDFIGFFNIEIADYIPFPCLFTMQPDLSRYVAAVLVIPAMVVVVWLYYPICSRFLPKGGWFPRWDFAGAFNLSGKILNILFISQVMFSMVPMQCYEHPRGDPKSIRVHPSTLCTSDEGDYTAMLTVGIISLLFCLSIFTYLVWELNRAPRRLGDPDHEYYMKKITFTIEDFKLAKYYWNIIGKLQELALGMVIVIDPDNTRIQLFLFLIIFLLSLTAWTRSWPYKLPLVNLMTILVYGIIIVALFLFTNNMPPANQKEDDFSAGALAFVLVCCIGLVAGTYLFVIIQRLKQGASGEILWIAQLAKIPTVDELVKGWALVRELETDEILNLMSSWESHELWSAQHVMSAVLPETGGNRMAAFAKIDSMRSEQVSVVNRLSKRLSGKEEALAAGKKTDDPVADLKKDKVADTPAPVVPASAPAMDEGEVMV